ncbi:30S ribosomal protein S6 [Candidatus Kuenenbacteria bacterium]|nr:30S ribosomal protein S6 [Candidatus Kuenenbacteria bacterium]
MNQHYELTYIVSIKYIEDDLQKVIKSVNEVIAKANGEITKETDLGKQRLAYPIDHAHQGTYISLEFDMEQEKLQETNTLLRLMPELLRHLIIKKKVQTEAEIKKQEDIQEKIRKGKQEELKKLENETEVGIKATEPIKKSADETKPVVTKKEKPAKEKVTLEDLDKKLDEILSDDIL